MTYTVDSEDEVAAAERARAVLLDQNIGALLLSARQAEQDGNSARATLMRHRLELLRARRDATAHGAL